MVTGTTGVLFNVAGMQPLMPYLLGKTHPLGKRLCNVQGCVRTNDIESVGDSSHTTFFEMMGSWSLGDYFKEERTKWSFELLTELNSIADIKGLMAEADEDPKVKALETSIDDMEFSVRAYNCLKRSGINTMQDLVNRKESDMMKIRNLGKKSLKEVLDKVREMGLSFREDD